jgi:hypothetical protein
MVTEGSSNISNKYDVLTRDKAGARSRLTGCILSLEAVYYVWRLYNTFGVCVLSLEFVY